MVKNPGATLAGLDDILKDLTEDSKPTPIIGQFEEEAQEKEKIDEGSDDTKEESLSEPEPSIGNGAYVRVDEDGMQAWLYLNPPRDGEKFYTKSDILQFLKENNVTSGYHNSNIAAIAKKHVYEREILVAKGNPANPGENGYYEYFFDVNNHKKPLIREDGTVDYANMSRLTNVKAGSVIAKYHKSIPNVDGYDVYGKTISSKPPKDLLPLKGRDISNDADPTVYIAKISGKIELGQNQIDIKNVHEVAGDVDLVTGKVEFFGDIHIKGNVGAGVMIRASRNVTVDGVVESATIYAGGDVVIAKGIQGGQKGLVIAKGNVCADFIELATVEAGGDIRSNTYVNAIAYAEGMVIADGKKGVILGGEVRGLKGVRATIVGNEMETKTLISSGYTAEEYSKYVDVNQREAEIQKALSDTVDQMTEVLKNKRLGRDINSDATDRLLLALNEKKDEYFEQLDKVRTERDKLSEVIERGKESAIECSGKIYGGVTVCVEGTALNVYENTSCMRYRNEGGKIVSNVLVSH